MSASTTEATDLIYKAIGRFIFEFSQTEYTIRHYLGEEIGLDEEYFSAVVGSYDVALLCTVATEVFNKSRKTRNAGKISTLISKFRELNDVRNRVAHGLWFPFSEGGTVSHTTRSKLRPDHKEQQAQELETRASQIRDINIELGRAFVAGLNPA